MGSRDNFALRWNDFHGNISTSFRQLRDNPEFQDVTLFCDPENSIKAHKVILSACSPYLHSALSLVSNTPAHSVLLLPPGIDPDHMTSLVDFMYYGEVSVQGDQLDKFLQLAETLQVRGLVTDKDESVSTALPPTTTRKRQMSGGQSSGGSGQMVGLVCPQCRTVCQGVGSLKAHMATCGTNKPPRPGTNRPVGQVAPEQRQGWYREHTTSPGPLPASGPPRGYPAETGQRSGQYSAEAGQRRQSGSSKTRPPPPQARQQRENVNPAPDRPDLATSIGRKFGGSVSISKVSTGPGVATSAATTQKKARTEIPVQVDIKEEPVDEEEEEAAEEEETPYDRYRQDDWGPEEEDVYGEDTGYPCYDDYGNGGPMFESTRVKDD